LAAERLGLNVTVGTEREQPLGGATVALDFTDERRLVQQVSDLQVEAVVGVDDDTTVQAARARALGRAHNSVESVKAARYKDVMRPRVERGGRCRRVYHRGARRRPIVGGRADAVSVCAEAAGAVGQSRVIRADDEAQFVAAFEEIRRPSCARLSRPRIRSWSRTSSPAKRSRWKVS
jgi:hypothetical protein